MGCPRFLSGRDKDIGTDSPNQGRWARPRKARQQGWNSPYLAYPLR